MSRGRGRRVILPHEDPTFQGQAPPGAGGSKGRAMKRNAQIAAALQQSAEALGKATTHQKIMLAMAEGLSANTNMIACLIVSKYGWPWQRWRARRQMKKLLKECLEKLQKMDWTQCAECSQVHDPKKNCPPAPKITPVDPPPE